MNRIISYIIITLFGCTHLCAQSFSLAECRKMAIAHNESLKTSSNAIRQAELERQIAFAGYLPKLDCTLTGFYMKNIDMMGMKLLTHGTYLAGLTITLPIYAGGQITAGNRLASIGKMYQKNSIAKQKCKLSQMLTKHITR